MAETFDYITVTTPDGSVQYKAPPMAAEFSASTSYAAGDYCTYQGALYRFSAAHSAGAWNSAHVSEVSLAGDVADLKSAIEQGTGLTNDLKTALLACFDHVVWDDDDPTGQTYIDALEAALYPPVDLASISAVYTQSGTVYDTDSLDSLKSDLVVTATYDDSSTAVVTTYTLSGTLTAGTSTVTVSYGGKTATFTVTVTESDGVLYHTQDVAVDCAAIDTGVCVTDSDKDFSIAFDVNVVSVPGDWRVVQTYESGTSNGIMIGCSDNSKKASVRYMDKWALGGYTFSGYPLHYAGVYTHVAESGAITLQYKLNGGTTRTSTISAATFVAFNNTVKLCGSSSNGFTGTIYDARIYNKVLDSTEISAYLSEDRT